MRLHPKRSTVLPDRNHEPMLFDIHRQPAAWCRLVGRFAEIDAFVEQNLRPDEGGHCYIFGSGDGWFAARAAAARSDQSWRPVSGLEFLLDVAPGLTSRDRALAISMSGNVDRTVEGAKAALARKTPLAILTNGDGGRLGALTDRAFRLRLQEVAPFLCGTTSYTMTLAVLMAARAILVGDTGSNARLRTAAAVVSDRLDGFDRFATGVAKAPGLPFGGSRFLSVGRDLATAEYAAAKLVELTTLPSWSDDIEEFAHRQFWTVGREELAVYVTGSPAAAAFASASAEALGELGLTTVALEPAGCPTIGAQHRLDLGCEAGTAPLVQAVALQLLAYRLALGTGTNPNRRLHLKDDVTRFAVSRKLTRRSLLGTGE